MTAPTQHEKAGTAVPDIPAPIHLVQVGTDDSVFRPGDRSDFPQRQRQYGDILAERIPGSRVTILILTPYSSASEVRLGNVRFIPVPCRRRALIAFLVFRRLIALHASDPITVVTTQSIQEEGLGAIAFRMLKGVPVVAQIHFDLFVPAAQRENLGRAPWRWLMKPLVFLGIRHYDAIRVVGADTRKRLLERGLRNVHLCPVAVPLIRQTPPQDVRPERKVIFVGRLEAQKRLDLWLQVAVEVAKEDPEARFELAGQGSLRPALEAQVAALGLGGKVRFLGLVAYDQLPRLYASAKVFLLTSSYEGLPRVVVEALHFRLPMVSFRITGVDEVVEHGRNGMLHGFGDVRGMAQSVLALLRDEESRVAMGTAGQEYVDNAFHPDQLSHLWVDILVGASVRA